jgi:hypothetical protein
MQISPLTTEELLAQANATLDAQEQTIPESEEEAVRKLIAEKNERIYDLEAETLYLQEQLSTYKTEKTERLDKEAGEIVTAYNSIDTSLLSPEVAKIVIDNSYTNFLQIADKLTKKQRLQVIVAMMGDDE